MLFTFFFFLRFLFHIFVCITRRIRKRLFCDPQQHPQQQPWQQLQLQYALARGGGNMQRPPQLQLQLQLSVDYSEQ